SITGCPAAPPSAKPQGIAPVPIEGQTPDGKVEPGPFAEGRAVFQKNCVRCHRVGDAPVGGPKMMMGKAPALTKVGEKRSRDWIIEHIRNPHTHTEITNLPAYDTSKISDADMKQLADYLTSLK